MRALVFDGTRLEPADVADPRSGAGEVLIEVSACGVCRRASHTVDGQLDKPKLPLILGHQIVGRVVSGGERFAAGDRVGVPWLGWAGGVWRECQRGGGELCA